MKAIIKSTVLFLSLLAVGSALAGSPRDSGKHMEHMRQALELDESQVPLVEEIMQRQHEQMKALHETLRAENAGADDEEASREVQRRQAHEQMRAIKEDTRAQLTGVLSQEQLQKLDELSEKRQRHNREKRGKHAEQQPDETA